jgi:lactate dehydrogenase-like 2-hydroxyacid dehydrogenase
LTRNFPDLTFAIIITDGDLVNLASNARTALELVALLEAGADQVDVQGVPPGEIVS